MNRSQEAVELDATGSLTAVAIGGTVAAGVTSYVA